MSGLVLMYNLWAVATRPERTKDSRETWNWSLWEMTYSFLACITEKRGRWMGRKQEDMLLLHGLVMSPVHRLKLFSSK